MAAAPSPGLQRIQARQPEVVRRAIELRATLGDAIEFVANEADNITSLPDDGGITIGSPPSDAILFDHDIAFCFNSAQSRLMIADGTLCFELTKPPPCAWWRFWQWALLGWRWIDLRKANE